MACLTGVLGVLLHGRGQLFHAGCSLFQRGRLLLGTGGEIVVAHGDFARAAVNGIGAITHVTHGTHQFSLHMTQRIGQLAHLVRTVHLDALHQVAAGDMANTVSQAVQRGDQGVTDTDPNADNHHQHQDQHA